MGADHGKRLRRTPTDKMLQRAESIAARLTLELPDEVRTGFDACAKWLDAHVPKVPPTDKQIKYARRLSQELKIELPAETLKTEALLSQWLNEHAAKDGAL